MSVPFQAIECYMASVIPLNGKLLCYSAEYHTSQTHISACLPC